MSATIPFFGNRITNNRHASEMSVAEAIDTCHEALDILPVAGTVTLPREALAVLLRHHADLAASVDALRRVVREEHDDRAPICAPCTRIKRGY